MAMIWLGNSLGLLLVVVLVHARPQPMEQRDISKDDAVREMYELLHARRQLEEAKPSNSEITPSPTSPPILVDSQGDLLEGGYSSHTQLCTDGLKFLSTGSSDHEKRNLVINYVYNICIRPELDKDALGRFFEFAQNTPEEDWSNWPGFDLQTTPKTTLTTEDYWDKLLNELFDVDIAGGDNKDATTTPVMDLHSTIESLDALLSDFINMLEGEHADVTTPRSVSGPSELENSLEAFLQFLEQGEDNVAPTTSRTTTGAEASSDTELDAAFSDLLHIIEELETDEDSTTTPQATTTQTTTTFDAEAAINEFWEMIDELEGDAKTTPSAEKNDNVLPPLDLNRRTEMKKRLLNMLATSLAEKKAMRK